MANEESREPQDLGQDPYVEKVRPDPSQPPEAVRILEGFMGESDREGYRRLYFTHELDYYTEFRVGDVVFSETIPPDQPPFLGQQATRVGLRRDATVEYARTRAPRPVDEFDLDVRFGALREQLQPEYRPPSTKHCGVVTFWTECLREQPQPEHRPRDTKYTCPDMGCLAGETSWGCEGMHRPVLTKWLGCSATC
jgi:hypothetical protein